jgi:hypothetical protein
MNPTHYYHTPIKPISTRVSCPVCHQAVYSRAGIHPQCAVIQQDPPRLKSRKPQADAVIEQATEIPNETVPDDVAKPSLTGPSPAASRVGAVSVVEKRRPSAFGRR